jgi:uncharacterized protein YlxP (DUF503 family)
MMHVGTLTVELHLPGCDSLKQKRSRLKPLLARLHREFNISAAEVGHNDHHRAALIACAIISNDAKHVQRVLEKIPDWIERHRPDMQVVDHEIMLY